MRNLTEGHIPEERLVVDVLAVPVADDKVGRRDEYAVELGGYHILHEDGACAFLCLHLRVERQVDGYVLDGAVGCSGIVEGVADIDRGRRARFEGLEFLAAWEALLECRQLLAELGYLCCAGEVFKHHESAEGALDSVEFVVAALVGAEYEIHLAVVRVKPLQRALLVGVGLQVFGLGEQVFPHARHDGEVGCRREVVGDLVDVFLVGVVIPLSGELAFGVPAYEGIRAVFCRVVECFPFGLGHVRRVEALAGRDLRLIAFYEAIAGDPVPWAVVDVCVFFDLRGCDCAVESLLVTEHLLPVDLVRLHGGETIEVENLLAVDGNGVGVSRILGADFHCLILGEVDVILLVPAAG